MTVVKGNGTVTLTFELDIADGTLGKFLKALAAGGFREELRQMGIQALEEAGRRGLPIDKELTDLTALPYDNVD